MCTVSWKWENDALSIYFSRDERRTRLPGLPPQIFESEPHRYLCPVDQDRGGTWFAANETGLAIALLNDYQGKAPAGTTKSRGHLVRNLAASAEPTSIYEAISEAVAADVYPPFTLLAWHGREVKMWRFPDNQLAFVPGVAPPVTSSSWDTNRVETWRKRFFSEKVNSGDWSLDQFHRYELPDDKQSSVCMTREKSRTVSLTTCRISKSTIDMEYFARHENGEFADADSVTMPINLLL